MCFKPVAPSSGWSLCWRHGPVLRDSVPLCVGLCRLVSANSVEEKLLKNGTKDLIREVAAQGNNYSMAFLTQVPRPWPGGGPWCRARGSRH